MQETMNPLHIYERLKHARMEHRAAKEIAAVFGDLMDHQLATRQNLGETETRIKAELTAELHRVKTETLKWMIVWVSGLLAAQTAMILAAMRFAR